MTGHLKRPWNRKIAGSWWFFSRNFRPGRTFQEWIFAEMTRYRPRHPAYEIKLMLSRQNCECDQELKWNASVHFTERPLHIDFSLFHFLHTFRHQLLAVNVHLLIYVSSGGSVTGLPRLLESPGFFSRKFQDLESPGKSLVLESPEN